MASYFYNMLLHSKLSVHHFAVILVLLIDFQPKCLATPAIIRPSKSNFCYGNNTAGSECVTLISKGKCTEDEMFRWNSSALSPCTTHTCGVYLTAFEHSENGKDFPRNALNITIQPPVANQQVWFMYQEAKKENDPKCFTLSVSSEAKCASVPIFFDCHIADSQPKPQSLMVRDSVTTFKAIINNQKIVYKFRNLFDRDLSDGRKVFFYVANEKGPPFVTFQVSRNIPYYSVSLCRLQESTELCLERTLVDSANSLTYEERHEDLISLTLGNTAPKNGTYRISVYGCDDPDCTKNATDFNNYDYEVLEIRNYALEITLAVFFLLFALTATLTVLIYRQKKKLRRPIPESTKLLLVYDARSVPHTEEVRTARHFLRDQLGIEVLYDETDIPQHSSPVEWYGKFMGEADCVGVIVPPTVQPNTKRGNPYQLTYDLCMNTLLENRWKKKILAAETSSLPVKSSDVVILLPSSDPALVPAPVRAASRFRIPEDYPLVHQHMVQLMLRPKSGGCWFNLPSWLLRNNQKAVTESFFRHLEQVQAESAREKNLTKYVLEVEARPLLKNETDEPPARAIQLKSKLDADFGEQIPSVTDLPPVAGFR